MQVFAQTGFVVLDEFVGCIQDMAVAAVVLLKLDLMPHLVLAYKVGHIAYACPAKRVNALVIVTHGQHRTAGATEQLDPSVLKSVGVLELVNQDMRKALLVMLAQCIVVAQQFVAAQHQLAKIHHAFALTLVFVELVNFDLLACLGIAHLHIFGTLAVLFATRNKPLQLFRRKAFVINSMLLDQALHRRELVLGVQNLKGLRQVGHLPMRPQKTVTQAMKSANPHPAHIDRQHGTQAGQHFFGGLVGEGHGHQTARTGLAGLQQPSNAGGEHTGFA